MSGIPDHQATPSFYDNERCHHIYQDGGHVLNFEEEAFKVITALKDASLKLGNELGVFKAPYSHWPSQAAFEEVQKNIQKL
jgi:hypothetical protein